MPSKVQAFIHKWRGSAASEKSHMALFLTELCDVLGVDHPHPKGTPTDYCFERDIRDFDPEGQFQKRWMDLYKKGHFLLEAKQATEKQRGGGASRRGPTVHAPALPGLGEVESAGYRAIASYDALLVKAFGQAINYAKALALTGERPPFLIVCDIGHSFHVWNHFDPKAGGGYGGFGARRIIPIEELEDPGVLDYLRRIWTDPASLDSGRQRAQVTRGIARELGRLAQELNSLGTGVRDKEAVARFLMRCVFTCFAEDIDLLPGKAFQEGLRQLSKDSTQAHERLSRWWKTMDEGGQWGWDRVLRFNGGLFKDTEVPPLSQQQIELLHQAARENWSEIEPAIFGTLLESALDERERHALGAHYTPRAYIQRLVDATFGHELRAEWEAVEAEVARLLEKGTDLDALKAAKARLHAFHARLASIRVLDPACGSGNFLYVAFDTLKHLEEEVLRSLEDLGETFSAFSIEQERISPRQFLGLELNGWAAQIAELVLWIAYLQWFRKRHPKGEPPEPVLQNYGSIRRQDAVLAWAGEKPTGRTRWGGRKVPHAVTGKLVPDAKDQVPIVELLDARPAAWVEGKVDYIIGNPPFLGNAGMREALGDGYVEALRAAYPEVPDTVDFVLYWWHRSAEAVRSGQAKRFGLITTNSLRQVRNRGVIARQCGLGLKLLYAIPDHPWAKDEEDAAVRIAMTVGGLEGQPEFWRVVGETRSDTPEQEAESVTLGGGKVELIREDLSTGAAVSEALPLIANEGLSCRGMELGGAGFMVEPGQWERWGKPSVVHPYRNGRDLTDHPRGVMVIDLFGLNEGEVRKKYPAIYQHLLRTVKPEREVNNVAATRSNWWLFRRPHPEFRPALDGLPRYIATVETAKHRAFQFLASDIVPDNKLIVIASDDALHLGILSSRFHVVWALAAGSTLEDRPVYPKSTCFDPFPFPAPTKKQAAAIRSLAEELDAHRKGAQARGVTLTQQYNLLEKLRRGEAFTAVEAKLDDPALPELLRDLHERLDGAVAEAYGWPAELPDEELLARLVALNAERRAEEAEGRVRWLRPDYQTGRGGEA